MLPLLACLVLAATPLQDRGGWVRFVDGESGEAVASVVVRGRASLGSGATSRDIAMSDEQGFAHCWMRAPVGTARAEGYSLALFTPESTGADRSSALNIQLWRPGALVLTFEEAPGVPLQNALVTLEGWHYHLLQHSPVLRFGGKDSRRGTTDADGVVRFENIPAYMGLRAQVRGMFSTGKSYRHSLSSPLVVAPREVAEFRFQLDATAMLTGTLLDDAGRPVPGVELLLKPWRGSRSAPKQTTKTDANGVFQFVGFGPGRVSIGLAPQIGTAPSQRFDGPWGEGATPIQLRYRPGSTIEGRVINAQGSAVSSAYVTARSLRGEATGLSTRTDATGRYFFEHLPAGEYRIRSESPQAGLAETVASAGDYGNVLTLRPGARLRGRVFDEEGRACSVEDVSLTGASVQGSSTEGGVDSYDLSGLQAGTYRIFAVQPDGRVGLSEDFSLKAGELKSGHEIHLQPGAMLELYWAGHGEHGQLTVELDGREFEHDGWLRGTRRYVAVPPGELRVVLRDGDRVLEKRARVAPGERATLQFD